MDVHGFPVLREDSLAQPAYCQSGARFLQAKCRRTPGRFREQAGRLMENPAKSARQGEIAMRIQAPAT
jgi:hypothetical protein